MRPFRKSPSSCRCSTAASLDRACSVRSALEQTLRSIAAAAWSTTVRPTARPEISGAGSARRTRRLRVLRRSGYTGAARARGAQLWPSMPRAAAGSPFLDADDRFHPDRAGARCWPPPVEHGRDPARRQPPCADRTRPRRRRALGPGATRPTLLWTPPNGRTANTWGSARDAFGYGYASRWCCSELIESAAALRMRRGAAA